MFVMELGGLDLPLMTRTEVVDLEAPAAGVAFVAELCGDFVAAHTFETTA